MPDMSAQELQEPPRSAANLDLLELAPASLIRIITFNFKRAALIYDFTRILTPVIVGII